MLFRQYQLSCLSLFSYLIGDTSTGRAVVVDPQRDIGGYLDDAAAEGLVIERVIETHFHADFLSGHLELARATGAAISYGGEAVADDGRETEAKVRLARIGFDRVHGAVVDVERLLAERPDLATRATRLAARDLASWRDDDRGLQIVDVRNPGEQEAGMVPGAVGMPLARLLDRHHELDPAAPTVVYCAGGYRSSTAASLLRSVGFTNVADLQGGYDAWSAAGLPTTHPQASSQASDLLPPGVS